jgi:dTMP kinase
VAADGSTDVPVDTALHRLKARGQADDRYERLGPDFFARVNEGFREIARAEPQRCVKIAADGTEQLVHQAVLAEVRARLGILA